MLVITRGYMITRGFERVNMDEWLKIGIEDLFDLLSLTVIWRFSPWNLQSFTPINSWWILGNPWIGIDPHGQFPTHLSGQGYSTGWVQNGSNPTYLQCWDWPILGPLEDHPTVFQRIFFPGTRWPGGECLCVGTHHGNHETSTSRWD